MRTRPLKLLVASLLFAAACDSDKVSWWFVGDTSDQGGGSGGVIIVKGGDGGRALRIEGDGNRLISAGGVNSAGLGFTAHLAVRSDVAVLQTGEVVEIRSPALPSTVIVEGSR